MNIHLHRATEALPDASQIHVDGLGLNDLITIEADARDPDAGGASHCYVARMDVSGTATAIDGGCTGMASDPVAVVRFQHGPRMADGSMAGCTNAVLIAIMLDRLRSFQAGPFSCRENALAITKLEEALHWMEARARVRRRQGVLGKHRTHSDPE